MARGWPALLAAGASAVLCGVLLLASRDNPLVYWFGGWFPRGNRRWASPS
ncbi:hypothetical protein ACN28S_18880 [Cystobacter fuscus]